jgi:Trk-type K+ transport system membrane component
MLLDIGNAAIEAIPLNVRFSSGLFQAVAIRAAGFTIFSLADVAPAVQWVISVFQF